MRNAWELFDADKDTVPREVRVKSRSVFASRPGKLPSDPLSLTFQDCKLKDGDIVEFVTDGNQRFPNAYRTSVKVGKSDNFAPRIIKYSMGMDVLNWKILTMNRSGLKLQRTNEKNVDILFHHIKLKGEGKEFYRPLYDPEHLPYIENGGKKGDELILFLDVKFLDIQNKCVLNTEIVYPWTERYVDVWTYGLMISSESSDKKLFFIAQNDGSFYLHGEEDERIIGKDDDPLTHQLTPYLPDPEDSERQANFFISLLNHEELKTLKKDSILFRRCSDKVCPRLYKNFCKEFWVRDCTD